MTRLTTSQGRMITLYLDKWTMQIDTTAECSCGSYIDALPTLWRRRWEIDCVGWGETECVGWGEPEALKEVKLDEALRWKSNWNSTLSIPSSTWPSLIRATSLLHNLPLVKHYYRTLLVIHPWPNIITGLCPQSIFAQPIVAQSVLNRSAICPSTSCILNFLFSHWALLFTLKVVMIGDQLTNFKAALL